jgi:hypothetical protein
METGTPNLHLVFALTMNPPRTSVLDELHRFLKRSFVTGSEEKVQAIWHHNELMEQVRSAVAILQHASD